MTGIGVVVPPAAAEAHRPGAGLGGLGARDLLGPGPRGLGARDLLGAGLGVRERLGALRGLCAGVGW